MFRLRKRVKITLKADAFSIDFFGEQKVENRFYLSSSPHFTFGLSTQKIMLAVLIALLPECIAGIIFFGVKALVTILVSVASCVVFEALFQKLTRQPVLVSNLSACVSGVMLALVCPPTVPVWMVVIGAASAVIVAKGLFGGIGSNVFNPALTGRAVLFISFPAVMGANWVLPKKMADALSAAGTDAVSSATPLAEIAKGTLEADAGTYLRYLLGYKGGCIGETSVLLILISFLFLLSMRIIDWRAPAAMTGTVIAASFLAALPSGFDAALQNAVLSLLTGGLAFGAVFMVTDYATSPVTKPGRLLFGFGCGLITFLIRTFGGYPEGVMFSILIMNAVAPFLNTITVRMYGYGKKGSRRPDVTKITQEFDLRSLSSEEK